MSYVRVYLVAAIAVWAICSVIIAFSCQCETNTAPAEPQRNLAKRNDGTVAKTPSQTTYLLVMIMSGPEETQRRQTIRETWLKLSTKGPAVFIPFFPIGTKKLDIGIVEKLRQENEQTGDLALIDGLEEAYSNLAEKTLKSMVYAYENYNFKYILKHPRLYWGFLDGRAKPIRKGKWKENDWILCDRYLPYQLGGGYVLSYDLVRFLAINAPLFKLYKNEDVSVGAWLAGLDVKYVHDPRFDTEWISRGCSNQYLITHKKTAEEMRALFQSLKDRKVLCEKEFRSRNSYVYDWSAMPSKCCERLNGSSIP